MAANRALFPIQKMAATLGISRNGFYAWRERSRLARAIADTASVRRISAIHKASKDTYGAPRIPAKLAENDSKISHKRVERWMQRRA